MEEPHFYKYMIITAVFEMSKIFKIFTVLLQEQSKIFAFDVLWFIYHNDPNFFEQSGLGKHCRPRPYYFRRKGVWSQSTLFVFQFAGFTFMAKPYSDFKIITAIVQVPKFFRFLLWMWQILIWPGYLVEEDLSSVNNVEHLNIILGKPKA